MPQPSAVLPDRSSGALGVAQWARPALAGAAAVAALLACADAWHDADPSRRFTPALRAMALARNGTDDTTLDTAARSLLSALARHPLTPSPAVAATATRLRRALNPASRLTPT